MCNIEYICSVCNKITPDKEECLECSECKHTICSDCIKELALFCECCENSLNMDSLICLKCDREIIFEEDYFIECSVCKCMVCEECACCYKDGNICCTRCDEE